MSGELKSILNILNSQRQKIQFLYSLMQFSKKKEVLGMSRRTLVPPSTSILEIGKFCYQLHMHFIMNFVKSCSKKYMRTLLIRFGCLIRWQKQGQGSKPILNMVITFQKLSNKCMIISVSIYKEKKQSASHPHH